MEDKQVPGQNQQSDPQKEEVTPTSKAREGLSDSERIDSLRSRLYDRGKAPTQRTRHTLAGTGIQPRADIQRPTADQQASTPQKPATEQPPESLQQPVVVNEAAVKTDFMPKKRSYRWKFILAGLVFFVSALGISSVFLFYGNNTISGENISIDVSGPLAIGGGEEIPLQIAIANQNTISIESATLIIDYPVGTQSASEPGRELFSDRQQLNNIGSGEVINVPIRAIVFGEENEEKEIHVSVEYRVRGSNATFFKEADPLRFKISSSPVVLSIDTVKSISSGQEMDIELTVGSNSPTELTDILIKAEYPFGFDFSGSDPSTVSGQDTWFIESLKPEEKKVIDIKGIVVGKQNEERIFTFSAGVPNERDRFNLASIFTTVDTGVAIEQPFLGIDVMVNGDKSETVVIDSTEAASVRIDFKNTLEDTIYDGKITAKLAGNALDEVDVKVNDGFYNSTTNVITWDSVDVRNLEEITPGRSSIVSFSLKPEADVGRTPEISIDVTVEGQRVFEDRVPQKLVGTVTRLIRITSDTELTSSAFYTEGPFTNTGPTPPVAEEVTFYALKLAVDNGSNDITSAEVTAVLPQYISWLDLVTPGDNVSYNATTRVMTWHIGDMDANSREEAWVQVSFLPSFSQVDSTPTILETQRYRATDRFTQTVIRTDASALTTSLFNESDRDLHNGRVQKD